MIMRTHQNVGNLKEMQDIYTVTELHKYLERYDYLNQQYPQSHGRGFLHLHKTVIAAYI